MAPRTKRRQEASGGDALMVEVHALLTAEQVRAGFENDGVAIAEWARANGFSPSLVRMVVAGRRKCLRGQSHKIAVALGMKRAPSKTPARDQIQS